MITAHVSVLGLPARGTSVGRYVRRAVEVVADSGLRYQVHASGTEVECRRLAEVFRLVERIDAALVKVGAKRVMIQLKIDDRRDKPGRLADKVRSALGRRVRPRRVERALRGARRRGPARVGAPPEVSNRSRGAGSGQEGPR